MFNSELEQKIVKFVKESPIGVTSSEIARYLNVNRMTMTKYLAIIKEKALIDFKQLGMAKLWYVPVNLSKEGYLNKLVIHIAASNNQTSLNTASSSIAGHISQLYHDYYDSEKLNLSQIMEAIVDAIDKIGGKARIVDMRDKKLTIKCTRCPFGDNIKLCQGLCATTSNIVGKLSIDSTGYSKVKITSSIAKGADHCLIDVFLRPGEEEGIEFK